MRRGNIFWGLILIFAGGLFLLNTLGIVSFNVWGIIWPVLLIGAGLWVLVGYFWGPSQANEHLTIPLEGAEKAHMQVHHGAGRFDLRAGDETTSFLVGDFSGGVEVDRRQQGNGLFVTLSVPRQAFSFSPARSLDWSLALNPQVALELELDMGANEALVDLGALQVHSLRLSSGASATRLILPAQAGFTQAVVKSGAASVTIDIPEGVAAAVRTSSGLASVQVNTQRFPYQNGEYRSPNYEQAQNRVALSVETGVGSVQVR